MLCDAEGREASPRLRGPELEHYALELPLDAGDGHLGRLVVEPERASAHAALARLAELGAQALANARAHAAALERAERDPLTGLANHGHVWAALEREAARAERHGGALSLVMFDVDRFKSWNDRRGHLEGDAALVRLARLVRERSRREDTAGRYGGDEFALVLPETTREGAVNVAEKIRAAAEQLTDSDAAGALSAGVATAPADGTSAAELVRAADARLYQAKAAGGNRVVSTGATRA